ncbi:hypothetical protein LCGC14_0936170 [marine sediment metagenome]|uniref:DUF4242 domain-containing protein n=1 Tax=marine sediment metagenome TaxID=412755 RepID=A0A0F9NR23_9ZZZZ|nr:DUF4242 domain-containing protein [Methylophaga sp.]
MKKFVIEREISGAGKLSKEEYDQITEKSCCVLKDMGPRIEWVESYVTDDKIYCTYLAPDADTIREHAEKGGFPANKISEVKHILKPTF